MRKNYHIKYSKLLILQEKRYFKIVFFVLIGASLEVAGVGSIGPFIAIMLNPELVNTNDILRLIVENSPKSVQENFVFYFGLFLVVLFFIVNSFLAFLFYYIEKISREKTASISNSLLKNYLKNNYNFFLRRNSNELIKNILVETTQVIHGVLLPILQSFGKIFIILFLCIFLFSINFKFTLYTILFFGIIFSFIFIKTKNILRRLSFKRSQYDKLKYIFSSEALESIKETKILNSENFFLNKFSKSSLDFAKVHVEVAKYTIFPKYLIEFIVLSSIVFVLIITSNNFGLVNQLPIISVFIFAGYRMLPAFHLIYSALSSIKKSEQSLNIIYEDLFKNLLNDNKVLLKKQTDQISFNNSIEFKNVNYKYDEQEYKILSNLNLKILKNEKIGVIGRTGIGKSTFIDLLTGLLEPTSGSIAIDNKKLDKHNITSWYKNISYVPQKIFFMGDSLEENITLGQQSDKIDKEKINQSIEFAELKFRSKNEENRKDIEERGKNLSGGEKQRVGIARAFYCNRDIFILDESTNAIDIITEKKLSKKYLNLTKQLFLLVITLKI